MQEPNAVAALIRNHRDEAEVRLLSQYYLGRVPMTTAERIDYLGREPACLAESLNQWGIVHTGMLFLKDDWHGFLV